MLNSIKRKSCLVFILTIIVMLVLVPTVFADDNCTVTVSLPEANCHPVRTFETGDPSKYVMTGIVICKKDYRF